MACHWRIRSPTYPLTGDRAQSSCEKVRAGCSGHPYRGGLHPAGPDAAGDRLGGRGRGTAGVLASGLAITIARIGSQDAELVALRISQHHQVLFAGLTDVHMRGAEVQQSLHLSWRHRPRVRSGPDGNGSCLFSAPWWPATTPIPVHRHHRQGVQRRATVIACRHRIAQGLRPEGRHARCVVHVQGPLNSRRHPTTVDPSSVCPRPEPGPDVLPPGLTVVKCPPR